MPELLTVRGPVPVVAATVLHVWSHPGRLHSEAAFAALAGVAPLLPRPRTPAATGSTAAVTAASTVLFTPWPLTRLGHDPRTRDYLAHRTTEGATRREIIRILNPPHGGHLAYRP